MSRPTVTRVTFDLPECKEQENEKKRKKNKYKQKTGENKEKKQKHFLRLKKVIC